MEPLNVAEPAAVQQRIALVVRDDLAVWQRLNVAAFLSSAIASGRPEAVGEPYRDALGRIYPRMFALPVMVFEAPGSVLTRILADGVDSGLHLMAFPERLFSTNTDADNRAAFGALAPPDMAPAGVVLYGGRNRISKLLASARKHP